MPLERAHGYQVSPGWTTVYDDTTGLHNRRYFYHCLSLECERARRQGTAFSLIVMRFERGGAHGAGPRRGRLAADRGRLDSGTRSEDIVALLGSNELAVVAMGVWCKMVPQVVERLQVALEGSLVDSGDRQTIRLGAATYGSALPPSEHASPPGPELSEWEVFPR